MPGGRSARISGSAALTASETPMGVSFADAVDVDADGGDAVDAGGAVGVLEGVDDGGDLVESDAGAVGGGLDDELAELPGEVAPFVDAEHDLAAGGLDLAAGHLDGGLADGVGDVVDGEAVAAEGLFRDVDLDLGGADAVEVDLGDALLLEEGIADGLAGFAEGGLADVAEELDVDHVVASEVELDAGFLGLVGEGGDAGRPRTGCPGRPSGGRCRRGARCRSCRGFRRWWRRPP